MDQYTALDAHFEKDGPLSDLHQKIYQKTLHPQQVRYCLVARVVLGRPQRTNDGNKTIGQEGEIFSDATVRRATLEPFSDQVRPSSLIGEVGGINRKFREFIVFQPDQIFVEYVIAYRRVRKFCDCNVRVSERTVVKNTENRGRTMIKCGNNDSCNFFRLLPLCYCGSGACVKTSSSDKNPNREYYSCAGRRGMSCEFFQWKDNNYISDTNPSKKQRYD
jgi:GRF zinc finger